MSLIKNFLFRGGSGSGISSTQSSIIPPDVSKRVIPCLYKKLEWKPGTVKEKNAAYVSVGESLNVKCSGGEMDQFLKSKMKQLELVLKFKKNFSIHSRQVCTQSMFMLIWTRTKWL